MCWSPRASLPARCSGRASSSRRRSATASASSAEAPASSASTRGWAMRSSALAALLFSTTALAAPLVGPAVGNADALIAEGSKLYNQKQYPAAADQFLKATRANPAALPAILRSEEHTSEL